MSLYRSQIGEAWTLKSAVDALSLSARCAGKPGWIWIAGFAYPTFLVYGWELVIQSLGVQVPNSFWVVDHLPAVMASLIDDNFDLPEVVFASTLFLLISLPLFRLAAGLARISSSTAQAMPYGTHERPKLKDVWRAGKGLTLSSCGLQVQVLLMFMFAATLCAGPAYFLMEGMGIESEFAQVCIGSPVLLLLAVYGVVLSTLIQLALHSLAQNRRGVASAMMHAWRLLRRDPWATMRTVAVDGVLILATASLAFVIRQTCLPLMLFLLGFTGVTRACYWAQAYRALGGLSPDDGTPGLEPEIS